MGNLRTRTRNYTTRSFKYSMERGRLVRRFLFALSEFIATSWIKMRTKASAFRFPANFIV